MTLLTIVQDAADELNYVRPTTVASNAAPDVQKMYRFANRVGGDLVTRGIWQVLRTEATFTASVGSEQPGVIPADFGRFVAESFWDRTNVRLVSGPITALDWQTFVANGNNGGRSRFTRRGDALLVWPPLVGNEYMAFEYYGRNFCQSAGGTPQARWTLDTDTGRIPEELFTLGIVALVAETEGLPQSASARAAYEKRVSMELRNDQPDASVMISGDIFGNGRRSTGEPGAMGDNSQLGGGGQSGWTWGG